MLSKGVLLGIDPGSLVCGYGVLDIDQQGDYKCLESGIFECDSTEPLSLRLSAIAKELNEVIDEFSPIAMAVEDIFVNKNIKSALYLAQARGVVLAVAGHAGIDVHSYPPALVKKTITGNGRASKEQVSAMVQRLVTLKKVLFFDETDALAVAITHAHSLKAL